MAILRKKSGAAMSFLHKDTGVESFFLGGVLLVICM